MKKLYSRVCERLIFIYAYFFLLITFSSQFYNNCTVMRGIRHPVAIGLASLFHHKIGTKYFSLTLW